MSPRALRVDDALSLLPDLEDLLPLRAALAAGSRPDETRAWAASAAYATLDTRLVDAAALAARVPELVEETRARVEAVYRAVAEAVAAAARGDDAGAARALVAAGEAEEAAGRLDAAEEYFERAREQGRRPRDRSAEGLALRRLGRVARARGELERALELYRAGYEVAEAQRDHDGLVVACQGLGNVYMERGAWEAAGEWYERGLRLVGAGASRELWQLESNLSAATRRAGRLEESAAWLARAEATLAASGDTEGAAYVLNARGLLRAARGDLQGAEEDYRQALAAADTATQRVPVLNNLAECLLLRGRAADAVEALRVAERDALSHHLLHRLIHVYRGLGEVARQRGDEDGFVFFEQALELCATPDRSRLEWAITQEEYGRFEAAMGRREEARARLALALEIYLELDTPVEAARARDALAALPAEPAPGEASHGDRPTEKPE
ncbi:MAG TPA: tetratricopeptide repeat protein [Longimicrobiaceae bacterium]|nr:tetratricopeptide repeat protein [Longimicrobiaceae bacterium]